LVKTNLYSKTLTGLHQPKNYLDILTLMTILSAPPITKLSTTVRLCIKLPNSIHQQWSTSPTMHLQSSRLQSQSTVNAC